MKRLEEEGDIAADYLEELLDIADLDGDIDIDIDHGRASLAIVAEGPAGRALRKLVGTEGEVLDALQELTRLAVQAKTGDRSRLMLDIAGYRAGRKAELGEVARTAIATVRSTGEPVQPDADEPVRAQGRARRRRGGWPGQRQRGCRADALRGGPAGLTGRRVSAS